MRNLISVSLNNFFEATEDRLRDTDEDRLTDEARLRDEPLPFLCIDDRRLFFGLDFEGKSFFMATTQRS